MIWFFLYIIPFFQEFDVLTDWVLSQKQIKIGRSSLLASYLLMWKYLFSFTKRSAISNQYSATFQKLFLILSWSGLRQWRSVVVLLPAGASSVTLVFVISVVSGVGPTVRDFQLHGLHWHLWRNLAPVWDLLCWLLRERKRFKEYGAIHIETIKKSIIFQHFLAPLVEIIHTLYVQDDMHVKKAIFTAPRKERTKWRPIKLGNFNCRETVPNKSVVDVQDTDNHVMEQVLLLSEVLISS